MKVSWPLASKAPHRDFDQVCSTPRLVQTTTSSPPSPAIENLHVVQDPLLAPPVGANTPSHGQSPVYGGHGVRPPTSGQRREVQPLQCVNDE